MDPEGTRVPTLPSGTAGGVLSREAIQKRLERPPGDVGALVIEPCDPDAFDADAVDLRLGSTFIIPYPYKVASVEFGGNERAPEFQQLVHVLPDDHITVPGHSTVLGAVFEYIKLPYDVSGQVLTKSSLARLFITIEGAPWIHPLYRGCLTLEIANASGTPIRLGVHQPIAQLVLFTLCGATPPPEDVIDSHLGPVGPELSIGKS